MTSPTLPTHSPPPTPPPWTSLHCNNTIISPKWSGNTREWDLNLNGDFTVQKNTVLLTINPHDIITGKDEDELAEKLRLKSITKNHPYFTWLLNDKPQTTITLDAYDDFTLNILAQAGGNDVQELYQLRRDLQQTRKGHDKFSHFTRSRGFAQGDEWIFVPGADLLNHSFTPNARFTTNPHKGFVLWSTAVIQPHEPITIEYASNLTNLDLLSQYGFADAQNSNESIQLCRRDDGIVHTLFLNHDGLPPISTIVHYDGGAQTLAHDLTSLYATQTMLLDRCKDMDTIRAFIEAKMQVVHSNLCAMQIVFNM